MDSTGLKVFGEGEWEVRRHGKSGRRVWRKIHLSVDEATAEVLAVRMTDGEAADGPLLPPLVHESQETGGRVGQASADGAYDRWDNDRWDNDRWDNDRWDNDRWDNDAFLTGQGIVSTIPPRKGSKIRQHGNCTREPLQRDANLRQIRKQGRRQWKMASGYSRRCLVETQMMRQKRILGAALLSREEQRQAVECRLRCGVLNRLTQQGMPDSYPTLA